jgi:hypothetical protein
LFVLSSAASRFAAWFHRWRLVILGAWVVHAFAIHYWFLGFQSWDGFTHRVPPAVELAKNGSLGLWKFNYWVLKEYLPFAELAHVPFLYAFKLPGVIIGVPLIVFPLCVVAIASFAREVTGEPMAGSFGALAYAAIPLVNQQPFSGYIDFIVSALLAFVLYAFLRLRTDASLKSAVRLGAGIVAFTLSRQHGIYMLVLLLPPLAYLLFVEREGRRLRVVHPRALKAGVVALGVAGAPAVLLQIAKIVRYGNPLFPYQFSFLGFTTSNGVTTKALFLECGLDAYTFPAMLRAFVGGWVWPRTWHLGGFFDSRHLGGGFVLVVATLLLPVFVRSATRVEKGLVLGLVFVSLLARDFWMPRYAYGVVLTLVVVVGRAGATLAKAAPSARLSSFLLAAMLALFAHGFVPEVDLYRLSKDESVGPRLNVTASPWFRPSADGFQPYPDVHGKFVILELSWEGFVLWIYGKNMTNDILGTVRASELGPGCTNLAPILAKDPDVLFIDDGNRAKDCDRECVFGTPYWCQAYRIRPAQGSQATLPPQVPAHTSPLAP